MSKKVTQAVVSYIDSDGNWQTALRGAEIDVHKDDLKRLENSGAFDAPESDPEPELVEDLSEDDDESADDEPEASTETPAARKSGK